MVQSGAGKRFETYVRARWREVGSRGMRGLCREAGITPEQLYVWFRGEGEPRLDTLGELARALRVTRADLVAALDGYDLQAAIRQEIAREVEAAVRPLRDLLLEAGLLPAATTRAEGTPVPQSRRGRAA